MGFKIKSCLFSIVFTYILFTILILNRNFIVVASNSEIADTNNLEYLNKSIKVGDVDTSILLLHGLSFKVGFTPLISELSKEIRVIAPDLPGFGLTVAEKEAYLVDDYLEFIYK